MVEPIAKGFSIAVTPKIRAMLAMLEPKTFPTAVSVLPARAAVADTIISGAEEPIARMVIPMTRGATPIFLASAAEPNTRRSALQTSRANPTQSRTTASSIFIPLNSK